jgi:hypothetical protein
MDHAQAAAKYLQSAEACLLKAKRSKNSIDWITLATKWEALARLCERLPCRTTRWIQRTIETMPVRP